jgi:signal peptidase I
MEHKEILGYIAIIIIGIFLAQHMNVVVSASMEPVLYRGDIIFVDSNTDNIQVGNIIVYHATWTPEPKNVVHRVINKGEINGTMTYRTKGDNNSVPDPVIVYPNQILYKVVSFNNHTLVIPKLGYITLMLRGL